MSPSQEANGGEQTDQPEVGVAVGGERAAGDHHHFGGNGREDGVAHHHGDDPQVDRGSPAIRGGDVHGHKVPHLLHPPACRARLAPCGIEILQG